MRLKAMLTKMNSGARCALACSSTGEAETNLFAFPGGKEEFAIFGLLWVIASTFSTTAATLAATFATTFSTIWLVHLLFLDDTRLWLTRNAHFGVRSCGMSTSGGKEPESRPAHMRVPVIVVVRSCHKHVAPGWSVAEGCCELSGKSWKMFGPASVLGCGA